MAAEFPRHPFLLSVREVEQAAGTDVDKGLTTSRAAELQQQFPPNELDVGGSIAWYTIFIRQLCNAMILVGLSLSRSLSLPPSLTEFSPYHSPSHHCHHSRICVRMTTDSKCRSCSSPWP